MRNNGVPAPFLDMAFGVLFVFLAIIIISTVDDPKKQNDPAPVPKAEFLITLTWDDGSQDDIDLYVRAPDGSIVYFRNKQTPLAFLDTDNTGLSNAVQSPDGSYVAIPSRQEVVTIRAIVPGEYVVNAHFYRKSSAPGFVNHAKMTLVKLNPYSAVTEANAVFDLQGQEQTLTNFTVDASGIVTSVFVAPVKMVGAS